jgi:Stage II sporulation protein E (SpoIIE)
VRGPGRPRSGVRGRTGREAWRLRMLLRRARDSQATWFVALAALSVLVAVAAAREVVPLSAFVLPVLLGGVLLGLARLCRLLVVVGLCLLVAAAVLGFEVLRLGASAVVVVTAAVMVWNARSRSRLGVAGTRGESMLVDLRDRLLSQGEMPDLPAGWHAEAVMRSADGASFAGDFMVAARSAEGAMLEIAVVDVSGKGAGAGTRALLLSGAFGGLIGSVPPAGFLPAANAYLLRQHWDEGFASAVHLVLDLRTGAFEVRSAGHPPAVQLHAGSGRWRVRATEGPVLGVLADAEFAVARGSLERGDVLLLYTDGLVESPQHDMELGIDRLLGEAERLATAGFDRGAARLVDRIASRGDDRGLVLVHRSRAGYA